MIRLFRYNEIDRSEIFSRDIASTKHVEAVVSEIISDVRARGDEALLEYCAKFDRANLSSLEVSEEEIEAAVASVEPKFLEILEEAAKNIYAFHSRQVRNNFMINEKDGVVIGQKILPIEKVGLYVPGGTAAYPSSVLMNGIPAKIAGCREIVMVTPPRSDGSINPVILAAAKIAGVKRIFKWMAVICTGIMLKKK